MKTKFLAFLILLLSATANLFGQFILAGVHGSQDYYFDVVPDRALGVSLSADGLDTITIDMNNDGQKDFQLSVISDDMGQWNHYGSCVLTPLHNNCIAMSGFDSCFANNPPTQFIISFPRAGAFSLNDTINRNQVWVNNSVYVSFNRWSANIPNSMGYMCYGGSFGSGSGYLGVKYIIPTDTLYGWISIRGIKYHSDSLIVNEFAGNLHSSSNETCPPRSLLYFGPNPTQQFLYMNVAQSLINSPYTITDLTGRIILAGILAKEITAIDLSAFPGGMYFVNIMGNNGQIIKIIKQ